MVDVARHASVSHQTVSRVLNEHPNVKEATRARVRSAIAELGYRPNRAARALATGHYQVIGVVAPATTLFGPVSMLAAVEEQAAAAGFTISVGRVASHGGEAVADAVRRLVDQRVAGVVVIASVTAALEGLDDLAATTPLVTVDAAGAGAGVGVDQEAGARLAVRHLLDAGHPTVWHVSGPPDFFDAAGRIEGWRAELAVAGAEEPPLMVGDWSPAEGHRVGLLLARMPEVTAVFAANDSMALGLLRALHEHGRRVPDDVSVVGFDDLPEAPYFIPPLTTVHQDFGAVARESLAMLLDRIDGAAGDERRSVTPTLVERRSVAPPPDGRARAF